MKVGILSSTLLLVFSTSALLAAQPESPGQPPTDVYVINTPDVNVVNMPLDVNVVNTIEPIPIQIYADDGACDTDTFCKLTLLTVPDGKRLVMEYIAVTTQIFPPGSSGVDANVSLITRFDDKIQPIEIGTTTNTGPGFNSNDTFAAVVKLYAQAGASVTCGVSGPGGETINYLRCALTGYLEDAN